MHPILVQLGPVTIRYYGLMYVIAICIGMWLLSVEVKRQRIPLATERLFDLLLWVIPAAIIGARLYYVAFQWGYYVRYPLDILKIWQGGLAIHGGVLGGALALFVFARRVRVPFWRLTDALAPSLILGQAIGRIGNLMNGDAFGLTTSLPWGIRFPADSPAGRAFPNQATHPTMIYEMLGNLMVFALLWFVLRKRPHRDGFIASMYFVLYSGVRFLVSFVRADSLWLGPLRIAQVVSVVLIIVFGSWIVFGHLTSRSRGGSGNQDRTDAQADS